MAKLSYIKLRLPEEKMEFTEDGQLKTAVFKRMETTLNGVENYDLNLIMHALSKWGKGGYFALYDSVDYQLCDVDGNDLYAR